MTRQISFVADAIVEAAVLAARTKLAHRRVAARFPAAPGRFVVLALGKLGGIELNYSSDIDLIMLYDVPRAPIWPRSRPAPSISIAWCAKS